MKLKVFKRNGWKVKVTHLRMGVSWKDPFDLLCADVKAQCSIMPTHEIPTIVISSDDVHSLDERFLRCMGDEGYSVKTSKEVSPGSSYWIAYHATKPSVVTISTRNRRVSELKTDALVRLVTGRVRSLEKKGRKITSVCISTGERGRLFANHHRDLMVERATGFELVADETIADNEIDIHTEEP